MVINRNLIQAKEVWSQGGPSYDDVAPFNFNDHPNTPHHGIPSGPLQWPWVSISYDGLETLDSRLLEQDQTYIGYHLMLVATVPLLALGSFVMIWQVCMSFASPTRQEKRANNTRTPEPTYTNLSYCTTQNVTGPSV